MTNKYAIRAKEILQKDHVQFCDESRFLYTTINSMCELANEVGIEMQQLGFIEGLLAIRYHSKCNELPDFIIEYIDNIIKSLKN